MPAACRVNIFDVIVPVAAVVDLSNVLLEKFLVLPAVGVENEFGALLLNSGVQVAEL